MVAIYRKQYIDTMLIDAGWMEGKNWLNEVEVYGMPNKSGSGFADYVLYDDAHRPLAVIEAKKTCADVASGRQQAELYADSLERQYGRRPVIFLTNGFPRSYPFPQLSKNWNMFQMVQAIMVRLQNAIFIIRHQPKMQNSRKYRKIHIR